MYRTPEGILACERAQAGQYKGEVVTSKVKSKKPRQGRYKVWTCVGAVQGGDDLVHRLVGRPLRLTTLSVLDNLKLDHARAILTPCHALHRLQDGSRAFAEDDDDDDDEPAPAPTRAPPPSAAQKGGAGGGKDASARQV